MRSIFAVLVSTLGLAIGMVAGPAAAQTYPSKPIHILIPYAPGGIADIAARILGAKLTEAWGQQVVVENKPGGNGFIALSAAAKATPDGYTLVMATAGDLTLSPALFGRTAQNDYVHFRVSDAPLVRANTQAFKSVADVVPAPRRNPAVFRRISRQQQQQPAGLNGWASARHPVPAHSLQGWRPGGGGAGKIFRSPFWQVHPSPRT